MVIGHVALRDVTLAVQPGEDRVLVGSNGAGKSTLMLHMNGILQPGSGAVTVSGLLVDDKTLGKVRARVGLVFQDPDDQLFSPTVFDDVAFGPIYQGFSEKEVRARVDRALGRRADVRLHIASLTPSERRGEEADRHRHRALDGAGNPRAWMSRRRLDPPRRGLITLLRTLPQTMLISTHDLRMVAELLPRTVVMDHGEVVADRPTGEVLADTALLEAHGLEL